MNLGSHLGPSVRCDVVGPGIVIDHIVQPITAKDDELLCLRIVSDREVAPTWWAALRVGVCPGISSDVVDPGVASPVRGAEAPEENDFPGVAVVRESDVESRRRTTARR